MPVTVRPNLVMDATTRRRALNERRRLALKRLVESLGRGGVARVAEAIGKTPDYVSRMLFEWDKPGKKGISEDSATMLERSFPGWDQAEPGVVAGAEPAPHSEKLTGHPLVGGSTGQPIAQDLSVEEAQTPIVRWEELMSVQLPEKFRVELIDGVLAPHLQAGDELVFVKSSAGRPGDLVLLRDAAGNHYARVLRERLPGQYVAHAPNPAYEPLDVQALELQIVGVCVEQRLKRSTISF